MIPTRLVAKPTGITGFVVREAPNEGTPSLGSNHQVSFAARGSGLLVFGEAGKSKGGIMITTRNTPVRMPEEATAATRCSWRFVPPRGLLAVVAVCGLVALAPPVAAATGDAEAGGAVDVEDLLTRFGPSPDDQLHAHEVRDFAQDKLRTVNRSLRKCLVALRTIDLNEDVIEVLQGIARGAGRARFPSATLAALEHAAGTPIDLTENDLERCIRAYDVQALLEARTAATSVQVELPTLDCPPPGTICQGTVPGQICCDSGWDCAQECDEDGDCYPYCEPQLCFPGEATVRDETGAAKPMKDVTVGDRVQVVMPDGSLRYEDVYMLTHKDAATAGSYLEVVLASGQSLTLSPRHFIPTAQDGDGAWEDHVLKGANELRAGDIVWHRAGDGTMLPSTVAAVKQTVATGAFNPLTLSGTIVVDGVVASAHSDWFLDGIVSAEAQGQVYQAMFAPVRGIYRVIGPEWMQEITERWGVVDFIRAGTTPTSPATSPASGRSSLLVILSLLAGLSVIVVWSTRRATAR